MTGTEIDDIGATAIMTAALRARESERPDRIVDDPYARTVVAAAGTAFPPGADRLVALMGEQLAVRTRFLDDALLAAAAERDQVVLLAAGMDSRPWRLAWPTGTRVLEVDRAPVLAFKRAALGAGLHVAVPADLADRWTDTLVEHGFDPARPTVWLVEGLLYALDPDAADDLLAAITAVSAPGSVLAFEHVAAGPALHDALREIGPTLDELWVGGPTDPGAWLARGGWHPEVHELADVAARYGRAVPSPEDLRGWLGTAGI